MEESNSEDCLMFPSAKIVIIIMSFEFKRKTKTSQDYFFTLPS